MISLQRVSIGRVVKIKLAPTDAQAHALHDTLMLCNTAAGVVSRVAQASEDCRAFALQKAVYHQLKALGLSAQPAVRTIKKVADAYATRGANLEAGNYGPRGGKRATDRRRGDRVPGVGGATVRRSVPVLETAGLDDQYLDKRRPTQSGAVRVRAVAACTPGTLLW
jgi:hypothetical protein